MSHNEPQKLYKKVVGEKNAFVTTDPTKLHTLLRPIVNKPSGTIKSSGCCGRKKNI